MILLISFSAYVYSFITVCLIYLTLDAAFLTSHILLWLMNNNRNLTGEILSDHWVGSRQLGVVASSFHFLSYRFL